ncbi:fic family toxin-antitoxin system, toxin component [Streptacidiphilus sp. EB103A]|uniref:fic family toxin-antitoxin system, toxin component n=1 Tax=Streptacidiphilus sp. EB103A TaxID=3156275 RepID=UPI0035195843
MILHVDLSWILDVARLAGQDDPAPIDFGVPIAAVERHRAVLTGQDVYDGPYVRAAALAHTLGRLRWLERSNLRVAVAAAHGYLVASGLDVKLSQDRVSTLATELQQSTSTAATVASALRTWST